jgi:hypothetical protein
MNAIIKPVELTEEETRRILRWAQEGAVAEITAAEDEYARHTAGLEINNCTAGAFVQTSKTRDERRAELVARIKQHYAIFDKLVALRKQSDAVKMEHDAKEIVAAVLGNRRAEERAVKASKVVGEGK